MNGLDELHTCSLGGFRGGLLFLQLFQLTRLPQRGVAAYFFLISLCSFAGEKIDSRAVGW